MKLVIASILFWFLLLPGIGRGQGIVIDENAKRNESLDYESRHTQRNRYRLENAKIYKKNNVRKVELFQTSNGLRFMLTFDRNGRIIKRKSLDGRIYITITDSIFEANRIIVIDSFFYENDLARIDTLLIDKVEIQARNNKIVRYDKGQYKSYKSGRTLNQRNDYYRNLLKYAEDRYYTRRYPNHGQFSPPKRIDGNFHPIYRPNYRSYAQPYRPLLSRKSYETQTFYLSQKKTEVLNITNASENEKSKLIAKNKTKYFVRGENFNERNYWFDFGSGGGCGGARDYSRLSPIYKEKKVLNNKGLIDTIFTITYYEQAKDKPCVKPTDVNFTDYLRGYSGVPVKSIQYYFRYEYFDE
ncbi:hypothetical protein [Flavobacterium sp. UBA7682]|uniref:hypothetical protein n=1 Tax=Flavobacterium sp. UBA7682 TaxID=1946560 RepID=UPI0025B9B77F|nr:hypothetical protein [Flavobacterium sp. UBA7682]